MKRQRYTYPLFDLEVTWRKDSRRMRIFAPNESLVVRMTVPQRTGEGAALQFLEAKRPWIESKTPGIPYWRPTFSAGERHMLFGQYHPLGDGVLPVGQTALDRCRSQLAMEVIQQELPPVIDLLGVPMPQVKLHNGRGTHGMCYPTRQLLSFTRKLTCYPMAVIRYLMVHEACHLIHAHHGDAFHHLVDHLITPGMEGSIRRLMNGLVPMPLPPIIRSGHDPAAHLLPPDTSTLQVALTTIPLPPDLLRPTRRIPGILKEVRR